MENPVNRRFTGFSLPFGRLLAERNQQKRTLEIHTFLEQLMNIGYVQRLQYQSR